MDDAKDEELITGGFNAFVAAAGPATNAEAVTDIRRIVAHRRKVRQVTLGVAALLVAVPIAAFAANPRGNQGPPFGGGSPSPSPSSSPSPSAPPAPLTSQELLAARVSLPAWADTCTGPASFPYGVVHTNLDNDPEKETAAIASCQLTGQVTTQVVAFGRGTGGEIVTLGQLAVIKAPANFTDLAPRVGGGVIAFVINGAVTQQREYAWDGAKFVQVGGPTEFPPVTETTQPPSPPAPRGDLMITATDRMPVIGEGGPDCSTKEVEGSYTITVKNIGNTESARFYVVLDNQSAAPPDILRSNASGWVRLKSEQRTLQWHAPLKPGQSATFTLTTTMTACGGGYWRHPFTIFGEYPDTEPGNDRVMVMVR